MLKTVTGNKANICNLTFPQFTVETLRIEISLYTAVL